MTKAVAKPFTPFSHGNRRSSFSNVILRIITSRCALFKVSILLALLLSGCAMVGPDFVQPKATLSQTWLDADDQRLETKPADYRGWWRVFNDPVLNRLIEKAYLENLSLKKAGVRVLEARAQLGIAIGQFYPQTQHATGSLEYNRISRHSPVGSSQLSYSQSQVAVNASWELDFWGKFRRAIESDNASLLATIADYDNTLVSLTGDVANAYIRIRTLEKRIGIAQQNAETQEESLKIAEARFQYGTTSELDVEQAKTILNNTLALIPTLESQLRQAKHFLSILLGSPPTEFAELLEGISDIPVSPPQVAVGIPADLLRRRPDIRSAEHQAAAQSALIGVAKADLYPSFSLSGTFGFLSSDSGTSQLADMFKWSSRTGHIGPSFQWNILNYGRITNNVRVQDARFQELVISYQNTVLAAQQEVEDNLIAFLKNQDRAKLLAQSVAAAKKALDLAVVQYREGSKDFTTVLSAQQSLLTEQANLATTLGDISISLVGVYRSLGGGWEIREGKELVPPDIMEEMAKRTNWNTLLSPRAYGPSPSGERNRLFPLPDW